MQPSFIKDSRRSKLGMRLSPGSGPIICNNTIPSIDVAHSLLIELFCDWKSGHLPSGDWPILDFAQADDSNIIQIYNKNTSGLFGINLFDGAWDFINIPRPVDGTEGYNLSILLDYDNGVRKYYENGSLSTHVPFGAVTPTFAAAANVFTLNLVLPFSADMAYILVRLTSLVSVPALVDDIILQQYRRPMQLHPELEAVKGAVASQWSFEDFTLNSTALFDSGIIGGNTIHSSANLKSSIVMTEKQAPINPEKNHYVFLSGNGAENAFIPNTHSMQSGAHIVEVLCPLQRRRWFRDDIVFWIADIGLSNILSLEESGGKYLVKVGDLSGVNSYELHPNIISHDHLIIAVEGTDTQVFLDGQEVVLDPGGKTPNFTGLKMWVLMARSMIIPTFFTYQIPLMRYWNYPAGTLPTNYTEEVKKRVHNPWKSSSVFGIPHLEYVLSEDVGLGSIVIPNTGIEGPPIDLFINGGFPWGNVRTLWDEPTQL